jgi:septin family protein
MNCLFNETHEAIHESCAEKYLNMSAKSDLKDNIDDKSHECKSAKNESLNEEELVSKKNDKSRLKELKQKLVEDEAKKQEKPKKKKIF